jgi:hypothetical protein
MSLRRLTSTAFLLLAGLLQGAFADQGQYVAPSERYRCAPPVLARIGEHFGLKAFSYPWNPRFGGADQGGRIVAGVCSRWPGDRSRVVAAFAYDEGVKYEKLLLVAIVDVRRDRVVAAYRSPTDDEIDGRMVTDESLKLDLAPYFLTPSNRAIGLRLNTNHDSCGHSGGLDDDLTLLVVNGNMLRPVLQATMRHWKYGDGNRCEGEAVEEIDAQTYIAIEPTSTKGLADLRFTAKRTDQARPLTALVKYNGDHYDLRSWDAAIQEWWAAEVGGT